MNKNVIAEIEALLALANQEVFLRDESPHPHEEQNDRIRAARTQIVHRARKTFLPALLATVKRQQEEEAALREALRLIAAPVITIVRMSWTPEQAADSYWAELNLRRALANKALVAATKPVKVKR